MTNKIEKKPYLYINERHSCQDDSDNENTQEKKKI
jgi:hypothetical protein